MHEHRARTGWTSQRSLASRQRVLSRCASSSSARFIDAWSSLFLRRGILETPCFFAGAASISIDRGIGGLVVWPSRLNRFTRRQVLRGCGDPRVSALDGRQARVGDQNTADLPLGKWFRQQHVSRVKPAGHERGCAVLEHSLLQACETQRRGTLLRPSSDLTHPIIQATGPSLNLPCNPESKCHDALLHSNLLRRRSGPEGFASIDPPPHPLIQHDRRSRLPVR